MFPGWLQDFLEWSFQMKDPKELHDLQLSDDPSYLMIPSYSMIPSYLMIPAIWWSPAIRWSIGSMDFDNQKSTVIPPSLMVLFRPSNWDLHAVWLVIFDMVLSESKANKQNKGKQVHRSIVVSMFWDEFRADESALGLLFWLLVS